MSVTKVTPVYAKQLADQIGVPALAKRLGISDGHLYVSLNKKNEINPVIEIACEGILAKMNCTTDKAHLTFVKTETKEQLTILQAVLKGLNLKYRDFTE